MLKFGSSFRTGSGRYRWTAERAAFGVTVIFVIMGPPGGVVGEYRCQPDSIFASSRRYAFEPGATLCWLLSGESVQETGSSLAKSADATNTDARRAERSIDTFLS